MTHKMALQGLKVLEWGTAQVGPGGCRALGDFGAQVIKIESTKTPDMMRLTHPQVKGVPPLENAPLFSQLNTSKMSITIDLKNPRGIDIFKRLVGWADVVMQNQGPGVADRLGLGYDELRKIKPDIIMVSASVAGQDGPKVGAGGYGWNSAAIAGITFLTGYPGPDFEPLSPGWNVPVDVIASVFVPIAILSALEYKRRTGEGQSIDLSQIETAALFLGPGILDYTVNRRIQETVGNRDPHASPHGAFRCRGNDEWCAIAVFTDDEWRAFCSVIGKPDLAIHPRFSTLELRKKNEDELEKLVEGWTINHTPQEVMSRMQTGGVPAGVVQNIDDILERDPQIKERALYRRVKHPLLGEFLHPAWPFILSETPCEISHAPLIGQDNYRIITEILGMSDEEFTELVNSKVLI